MAQVQSIRIVEMLPMQWEIVCIVKKPRPHLLRLYERYGIATLELFGSYTRNEQTSESGLDVLVSFSRTPTFIDLADLEDELADIVGIPVDVALRSTLRPGIARNIRQDMIRT